MSTCFVGLLYQVGCNVPTCADVCLKRFISPVLLFVLLLACVHRSAASTSSASLHLHPSSHWRAFGASSAVQHADLHEKQPASSNSSSASEAATSFIVNPAGSSAAPQPLQHAPTAGGVLAGPGAASLKEYSLRQVSKHADDESCWIVVNGKV
jgi:cytochrome b involved in lipid metabolism